MGRRGRKSNTDRLLTGTLRSFGSLKKDTVRGIFAVIFFIVAILLVLASLERAGYIGTWIFNLLSFIAGVGYYLFPILLVALGISFFKKTEHDVALWQSVGAIIFFIAGLGLIELGFDNFGSSGKGGVLGNLISSPLVRLFDAPLTAIILLGIAVIATFIMFDTSEHVRFIGMKFAGFFRKRKTGDLDEEEVPKIANLEAIQAAEARMKAADPDDAHDSGVGDYRIVAPVNEKQSDKRGSFRGAIFRFSSQKPYVPPPLSLLEEDRGKPGVGDIKANSNIIKRTLQNFGIDVEMDEVSIGPSVTRYALKPAEGVKLARIVALNNDLALALAAHPIRIEAPIPGKSLVGIEIPNSIKTTVGLGTLLGNEEFTASDKPLYFALGKSVSGRSHYANLAKMPHVLVAGATGSGKSVSIHALITSLLYRNSPENMKMIMIDPKRVELTLYNNIPHLLTPVITDPKKAILALKWAAKEMDRRYDILEGKKVRDIESYHKNILEPELAKIGKNADDPNAPETMPYILIVIDELADIMQSYPRELEAAIVRLAQMSRAVGIHLVLSTQRPSVNVITGLIKANVPTRIALQVASQVDSRTILDASGAEKLLGAGDMLFSSADMSKPVRLQSAFISEKEVKNVVNYLRENYSEYTQEIDITTDVKGGGRNDAFDSFGDEEGEDELYEEAREIVMKAGKASTSYLQRKLRVGYARAARLIDMLEERGVVSGGSGAKPRDVLMGGSGAPSEGFGETDDSSLSDMTVNDENTGDNETFRT